jgi:hypothetical protein
VNNTPIESSAIAIFLCDHAIFLCDQRMFVSNTPIARLNSKRSLF